MASQLRGTWCSQPAQVNLQEQFACQGASLGGLVWQLLPLPGAGPSGRVCRQGGQMSLPSSGAAGDTPSPIHGCRSCPKLCPQPSWVHSMEKLAGAKTTPGQEGEALPVPQGSCTALPLLLVAAKCWSDPCPVSRGPCPTASRYQPTISQPLPRDAYILAQASITFKSSMGANAAFLHHHLHHFYTTFYREVFLIYDIIFPMGLLKHRGVWPRSQQGATAWEMVLQGRICNSQDIPALHLPLGRK